MPIGYLFSILIMIIIGIDLCEVKGIACLKCFMYNKCYLILIKQYFPQTCVLEKKTECDDSFGENVVTTACNESDMTQDLEELQPTQPIIPSNLQIEHSFTSESNNANKNKDEKVDDDDDEWQLKFSETQTQDALINFQKDDQSDEGNSILSILASKLNC